MLMVVRSGLMKGMLSTRMENVAKSESKCNIRVLLSRNTFNTCLGTARLRPCPSARFKPRYNQPDLLFLVIGLCPRSTMLLALIKSGIHPPTITLIIDPHQLPSSSKPLLFEDKTIYDDTYFRIRQFAYHPQQESLSPLPINKHADSYRSTLEPQHIGNGDHQTSNTNYPHQAQASYLQSTHSSRTMPPPQQVLQRNHPNQTRTQLKENSVLQPQTPSRRVHGGMPVAPLPSRPFGKFNPDRMPLLTLTATPMSSCFCRLA